MDTNELYEELLKILMDSLKKENKLIGPRALERKIGINCSSIVRWVSGEMGRAITLKKALEIAVGTIFNGDKERVFQLIENLKEIANSPK